MMISTRATAVGLLMSVLLVSVPGVRAAPMECQFTSDCTNNEKCANVQDVGCVCNNGVCSFVGNPFTRGLECDTYTDCNCRDNPLNCVCHDGFCSEERWECHEESDCKNLKKCKDIDCKCDGYNVCEPYDCYTDDDCFKPEADHFCATLPDYTCQCNNNTCDVVSQEIDPLTEEYPDYIPESDSCEFSSDCKSVDWCANIQDATCVCNVGSCRTVGNPFFRDTQCDTYTDCSCRDNPLNCVCHDGVCNEDRWECHVESDCKNLDKCKNQDCKCTDYNVCEPYDCYTDLDCLNPDADHFCASLSGYTCKCNSNTCDIVEENSDNLGRDSLEEDNLVCKFTSDCATFDECALIQDASCVCNRGNCRTVGNPFFRGDQCDTYTDCNCRDAPLNCVCHDGFCKEESWECQVEADCKLLDKCKDIDCKCDSYNVCEPYDCYTDDDCLKPEAGHFCATLPDYTCQCNNHSCDIIRDKSAGD